MALKSWAREKITIGIIKIYILLHAKWYNDSFYWEMREVPWWFFFYYRLSRWTREPRRNPKVRSFISNRFARLDMWSRFTAHVVLGAESSGRPLVPVSQKRSRVRTSTLTRNHFTSFVSYSRKFAAKVMEWVVPPSRRRRRRAGAEVVWQNQCILQLKRTPHRFISTDISLSSWRTTTTHCRSMLKTPSTASVTVIPTPTIFR